MSNFDRDPILLTPGPLTTSLATKSAMLRDWGSWDSRFNAVTTHVRECLTAIVNAEATHVCVPMQRSGTFLVEERRRLTMNLHCKLALLALVGVGICTEAAFGQPVAEKPDWKIGDYWQFRQTTTPGDQATTWSRKIEAFLPDDRIQVRFGNGKLEQYDSALNFMPDGRADDVRILARYPLKVGAEWTYARKLSAMQGTENGSAKIVAYESITVPAGTFACYRIDIVANYANKAYSERRLWNRWYCPEVKWIAKERLETIINNPFAPGGTTVALSELVKFTRGD